MACDTHREKISRLEDLGPIDFGVDEQFDADGNLCGGLIWVSWRGVSLNIGDASGHGMHSKGHTTPAGAVDDLWDQVLNLPPDHHVDNFGGGHDQWSMLGRFRLAEDHTWVHYRPPERSK